MVSRTTHFCRLAGQECWAVCWTVQIYVDGLHYDSRGQEGYPWNIHDPGSGETWLLVLQRHCQKSPGMTENCWLRSPAKGFQRQTRVTKSKIWSLSCLVLSKPLSRWKINRWWPSRWSLGTHQSTVQKTQSYSEDWSNNSSWQFIVEWPIMREIENDCQVSYLVYVSGQLLLLFFVVPGLTAYSVCRTTKSA